MNIRGHIHTKLLLVLIIGAAVLGLGLAKAFYPTKNPLIQDEQTTLDGELPYVFPPATNPFEKTPPAAPSGNNSPAQAAKEPQLCIQVVTPAVNRDTLEIREFPTPCDVPEGWEAL